MTARKLADLVREEHVFLIRRVLHYARINGYTKYTSTLEEAWKVSIEGLNAALIAGIARSEDIPELSPDEEYTDDPMTAFGILEARMHRDRGVTLSMFLGLMKYYRQAYLDLVGESGFDRVEEKSLALYVARFFDRIELAFIREWAAHTHSELIDDLQAKNRNITNEKNKYLTIFESIPTPVILLDCDNYVDNMNHAAFEFLERASTTPGALYYGDRKQSKKTLEQIVPWLMEEFTVFVDSGLAEMTVDKDINPDSVERRNLQIKFHRMLDISDVFKGTVIIFSDLTERKLYEESLFHLSFHDLLTGLYNRAYFEQEMARMAGGRFDPVGIIVADLDGLKQINDLEGHQAGDRAIKAAAEIMHACFRESDVVARIGGDEFAVLINRAGEEVVSQACQRIRAALQTYNANNTGLRVRMSLGTAVGEAAKQPIAELFTRADNAMYREKQYKRDIFNI